MSAPLHPQGRTWGLEISNGAKGGCGTALLLEVPAGLEGVYGAAAIRQVRSLNMELSRPRSQPRNGIHGGW